MLLLPEKDWKRPELISWNVLQSKDIKFPPVSALEMVPEIAKLHWFSNSKKHSCSYEDKNGTYHVHINCNLSTPDICYACSFELGHIYMDHLHCNASQKPLVKQRKEDLDADCFARFLVMARPWVDSFCKNTRMTDSNICALAKIFGMPTEIMTRHLFYLGLIRPGIAQTPHPIYHQDGWRHKMELR